MKVVINIATKGDRSNQLRNTLKSLEGQYDELNIYDNSTRPDLTDNGKFYFLQFYNEPVYYLTCDDDLIYPPNYVKKMIQDIEVTNSIVSYHGRIFTKGIKEYYNAGHFQMHHWRSTDEFIRLDVGGTGVMGFRTDYFNPVTLYQSEYKRMSDLLFSYLAWNFDKKIISPPKRHDYIIEQPVESSIFTQESKGKQVQQIELMNKIIEWKKSIR